MTGRARRYHRRVSEFVVITGLSGAGRSQAADILEDLGWFVIDNLPAPLIPKVAELARRAGLRPSSGSRSSSAPARTTTRSCPRSRALRRAAVGCASLFLEASTDVLVRRYESTRRRHPLATATGALAEAIERERVLLEPVKAEADVVVDTSDLNVHQLRDRVDRRCSAPRRRAPGMQTTVDVVRLQARPAARHRPGDRLPLPAQPPLGRGPAPPDRASTSRSRDYVLRPGRRPASSSDSSTRCSTLLLPAYVAEGKSYLTIAFGCTGGPAPLGGHRRGGGPPAAAARATEPAGRRTATSPGRAVEPPELAVATQASRRIGSRSLARTGGSTNDHPRGHQRLRPHRPQLLPGRRRPRGRHRLRRGQRPRLGRDHGPPAQVRLGHGPPRRDGRGHRRRHRRRRRPPQDPRRARPEGSCPGATSASTWSSSPPASSPTATRPPPTSRPAPRA